MTPSFTVGDVPLNWTATAPVNLSPRYRFAMQLFAPTGTASQALTAAGMRERTAALAIHGRDENDLDALAADSLIKGLLLYVLYALPGGPQATTATVTGGQIAWLAALLDQPMAVGDGFATGTIAEPGKLAQFFAANVHLQVSGLPAGADPALQSGMAMAMPPFLSWTSNQTGPVDFAADNKIGPLYLWGVRAAAASFSPSGTPPPGPPDDLLAEYVSFASHLFGDWALLIAKAAVREAAAALDDRTLPVATVTDTLASIARSQPQASITYLIRPGDTVDTVADTLGASVAELNFLNPSLADALRTTAAGGSVAVAIGVSPQDLATDNPGAMLAKSGLNLGDITVPVTATDTLTMLATRYNSTAAAILSTPGQDIDAKLLAAGAMFDAPVARWITTPTGCTAVRAAAIFYVRYAGAPVAPDPQAVPAAWYTQVLADLNAALLEQTPPDPRSHELPSGLTLSIPIAYENAAPAVGTYITVVGDTLVRIGAALELEQNRATIAGTTGWPLFRDGVTTIGDGFAMPRFAGVELSPGETFAMLARRTVVNWTEEGPDWAGLGTWLGDAAILAPLSLITIPNVITPTGARYSFASLAAAYGIGIADVGHRLQDEDGLVAGVALTVKHLPADTVQSLLDRIGTDAVGGIANETSRFLFSGQNVPIPVPVAGQAGHVQASPEQAAPLFDESRQQWTLAVDKTKPTETALTLSLSAQAPWITFAESDVIGAGEDRTELIARSPAAATLNRALAAGRALPVGAIVLTAATDTLEYGFTNKQVIDAVPATGLAWPPHHAASAIPVKGESPVTYDLARQIPLQTPVALPVPGFDIVKTTLSIHAFPAALRARAAAGSTNAYQVFAGMTDTDEAAPVPTGTFAMLVAFTVQRIAGAPGIYQLVGAATEQLPVLLDLIEYLTDTVTPPPGGTEARVAIVPAVTAGDSAGLAVVDGSAWLIKSNLSTETVPPSSPLAQFDRPPPQLCRADLSSPDDFALLLWEGSTVGGFGYTFGLDGGLSEGAFDANDEAVVQLLVIAGAQQAPAPDGRTLLKFDTSLIVVDQGIAEGAILFAEAHGGDDPSERIVQALVPPGSAGFNLLLTRPIVPDSGGNPEDSLRQQYSLVTATVASSATCPFTVPPSGLPAIPQASDGTATTPWQRARRRWLGLATDDPAPKPYWAYQTVLPVYRFGPDSVTPAVPGLPPPLEDPYRGLGSASARPDVAFEIGFGDLLGNRSADGDATTLCVKLGYLDPLNGPTAWPAVNASYAVTKPASTVMLAINLAAKAQALMPAIAQRGDALVDVAKRQQAQYATIYYQYAQPGLTVTAETSLQASASLPLAGAPGLRNFAAGAYLLASGAAKYGPIIPVSATLDAIVTGYGVGWDALAAVNANVALNDIFGSGTAITVPAYAVMASGDAAHTIAAVSRPGWPAPDAAAILGDSANQGLPLRIGATLACPLREFALPATDPTLVGAAGLPVNASGALADTAAGWLAADSATDAILVGGFVFTVDGVMVTVGGSIATLADVVLAFAALGIHVTAYDLGQTHARTSGMLIPAATAHSAHYVVSSEATLATNASGASTADLVAYNLATPDLFEPGTLIALGDFGPDPLLHGIRPAPDDTLAGFAGRYACPPAALLAANGGRTVIADSGLAIPGAVALPPSSALFTPYTIRPGDILSGIAAGFDRMATPDSATALATGNADLPGTVAQGLSFDVTVGESPVPVDTDGLTSFAAVLASVQSTAPTATIADVAAAFETPGRLAAGGLLIAPPVLLASEAKQDDIWMRYGVRADAFALANAGVPGLLISPLTLAAPDPTIASESVTANDTLNSVLGRFNAAYVAAGNPASVTIPAILAANPDLVLFASGARAVLPPADIQLTTPIAAAGPYPGAAFALTVELVVARPPALVDPAFIGTPAESTRATIAPPADGVSLNFNGFEQALTAALPNLRLATAKAADHAADLWAVDFDQNGISAVGLSRGVTFGADKQARMIGLAPLYAALVTRTEVPIAPLIGGSLDPAQVISQAYQGIDVEVWAARFLADFDRILAPASVAAINADVAIRPQFARLMSVKAQLQTAIPGDLAGIFRRAATDAPTDPRAVVDPDFTTGLAEARSVLGQALGSSLSAAWSTAAIVQYDASVTSPWTTHADPLGTAALYGEARAKGGAGEPLDNGDPRWRMAAGKVDLTQATTFLTLPLSVSDPAAQRSIMLDLDYTVSNLEVHRRPVPAAPGNFRSDWLALTPILAADTVPAALRFDLGPIDVPVPLKSFPALPLIVAQTATADPTDPPTLTSASKWTFGLDYSHEHAAQDQVNLIVELNLSPPTKQALVSSPNADLFTALAQYVAVADELNDLLAGLSDPKRLVPATTLTAAVTTFADLATDIGQLWRTRLASAASSIAAVDNWVPDQAYPFSAAIVAPTGTLTGYTLTRLAGAAGPGIAWPEVRCQTLDGSWVTLIGKERDGDARDYAPPDGIVVRLPSWRTFALDWAGLNIGTVQNGRIKLEVVRNADLLGSDGPATAAEFVYRTPLITASDIVTPGISHTNSIPMAGADVAAALQAALDALFPPATRPTGLTLTFGLYYGYTLVPGDDPLVSELAVGLVPDTTLDDDTAGVLAGALAAWQESVKPNPDGAVWIVSLTLYSSYDPGKRPLLTLDRLSYSLTA